MFVIFQAVHDDMDCKQYQQYTLNDANDENTKKTKQWIDVSIIDVSCNFILQCIVYILYPVSCILYPVFCILYPVSCVPYCVWCISSKYYCFPSYFFYCYSFFQYFVISSIVHLFQSAPFILFNRKFYFFIYISIYSLFQSSIHTRHLFFPILLFVFIDPIKSFFYSIHLQFHVFYNL